MNFPLEDKLPSPPAITVDTLRRLLADLPPGWQIIGDEADRFLILDEDGAGRGYIGVAEARIMLIDELPK